MPLTAFKERMSCLSTAFIFVRFWRPSFVPPQHSLSKLVVQAREPEPPQPMAPAGRQPRALVLRRLVESPQIRPLISSGETLWTASSVACWKRNESTDNSRVSTKRQRFLREATEQRAGRLESNERPCESALRILKQTCSRFESAVAMRSSVRWRSPDLN